MPAGGGTPLITVGMSAAVAASRARVWSALAEPAEAVRWRPGLVAPLEGCERYPHAGEAVRWRCRVRELPLSPAPPMPQFSFSFSWVFAVFTCSASFFS